jgi:hypothetical protein
MTEAEWMACTKLEPMSAHIRLFHAPKRKQWLFGCACCRRIWTLITDERSRRVVEVRERHLDGLASEEELWEATVAASSARKNAAAKCALREGRRHMDAVAYAAAAADADWATAVHFASSATGYTAPDGSMTGHIAEQAAQCELLRDIFGNPFRPATLDPAWRTSTVTAIAKGMYDSRDFTPMPILADALQDAGCDNDDILSHCRDPKQVHVRGCWVVDLVLGKK